MQEALLGGPALCRASSVRVLAQGEKNLFVIPHKSFTVID